MKLFTKYNRVNIGATILVFLIGSIGFYFALHYVLIRQLDDSLKAEQQEVTSYIAQHNELPSIQNTKHQWIEIKPGSAQQPQQWPHSIELYNPKEDEQETVRQLVFGIFAAGKPYTVTVNKSVTETEDLLQLIILVTITMIFLMLLFNYIINRRLVKKIWQPFYNSIDAIRHYRLQTSLKLPASNIEEIEMLNESVNAMTDRIHHDYQALRSLTENASHEMQTPLAVIHSKVEALMQEMQLNESNLLHLTTIENAAQKLSKLHQSLLLLTKLENRQFLSNEQVNLAAIVRNKVAEREELLEARGIVLTLHCEDVILSFHQHLAEIMVGNLFNNAVSHTPPGKRIDIALEANAFVITNDASGGTLDAAKIFQRFYKGDTGTEGTGLGLAIVQEICHLAGFNISYQYQDQRHEFRINF